MIRRIIFGLFGVLLTIGGPVSYALLRDAIIAVLCMSIGAALLIVALES